MSDHILAEACSSGAPIARQADDHLPGFGES